MSETMMNQEERARHLRTWMRGAIAKHLSEDHADDVLATGTAMIPQKRQDQVKLHASLHPEFAELAEETATVKLAEPATKVPAKPRRTARKASPAPAATVPEVLNGVGPKDAAEHEADQDAAPKPRARKAPAAKAETGKAPVPAAKTAKAEPKAKAEKVPLYRKHATEPAPRAMAGLTEFALALNPEFAPLRKIDRGLLERFVCVVSKDYRTYQASEFNK